MLAEYNRDARKKGSGPLAFPALQMKEITSYFGKAQK